MIQYPFTTAIGTNDYTISYFIRLEKYTATPIHVHSQDCAGIAISHYTAGTQLLHGHGAWSIVWNSADGVVKLPSNVLSHVTFTRKDGLVSAYLNGKLLTNKTDNTSIASSSANITTINRINGINTSRIFHGMLQDVRYYTRALSSNEIADIYTRPWTLHDQWQNTMLVPDRSGNGNTATNYGASLTQTSDGIAAVFNGVDNYIDASTFVSQVCTDTVGTILVRFRITTTNQRNTVFCFGDTDGNSKLNAEVYTDGTLLAYCRDASGNFWYNKNLAAAPPFTPDIGVDYCMAIVQDGTTVRFYFNGIEYDMLDLQDDVTAWLNDTTADNLLIGCRQYNNDSPEYFINGSMSLFSYYSTPLTSNDVYTISTGGTITNAPVASYDMQPLEQSGSLVLRTCINDRYNHFLIRDLSGHDNTATNYGAVLKQTANGWKAEFGKDPSYLKAGLFDTTGNVFTVGVCFTSTGQPSFEVLAASYSTKGWSLELTADGSVDTYCYSGGYRARIQISTNLHDGNPHLLVYTVDGDANVSKTYIDGVEAGTGSGTTKDYFNSGSSILFSRAQSTPARYLGGNIEYAFIAYDYMSSNQVLDLYNSGLVTNADFYYPMQPAYLNTGDELSGIARNYGSGPDGTYSNGPAAAPWTIQLIEPKRKTFYSEYNTNLVRDMSGNGNTSTNFGVELYQTSAGWIGEFGNGAYIKGGDYTTHTTVTICAKVKLDTYRAPTSQNPIFEWYADFNNRLELFYYNYGFHFQNKVGGSWNFTGGTMYCPDNGNVLTNWTVVCATHDGVEACLYVNGEIKTNSLCSIESVIDGTTYLGYFENQGTDWQGRISDALYFNRALTSNEVYSLWNNIRSFDSDTNLLIHYIMQPEFK